MLPRYLLSRLQRLCRRGGLGWLVGVNGRVTSGRNRVKAPQPGHVSLLAATIGPRPQLAHTEAAEVKPSPTLALLTKRARPPPSPVATAVLSTPLVVWEAPASARISEGLPRTTVGLSRSSAAQTWAVWVRGGRQVWARAEQRSEKGAVPGWHHPTALPDVAPLDHSSHRQAAACHTCCTRCMNLGTMQKMQKHVQVESPHLRAVGRGAAAHWVEHPRLAQLHRPLGRQLHAAYPLQAAGGAMSSDRQSAMSGNGKQGARPEPLPRRWLMQPTPRIRRSTARQWTALMNCATG